MTSVVQVYLNSEYATKNFNSPKNSDLIFLFTSPIVPPPNYNMTLRVVNLYLPVSFYVVDDDNNTFTLNDVDYTIPAGNYTATQLETKLMRLVDSDEPAFTVEFSSTTNKFTFSNDEDFTISGTCDYVLGLDGETSSSSNELTSTYPCDLTGQNVVYVDVSNLTTQNLSSSTGGGTSVVKSVLVNVPYGSVLYYEDTSGAAYTIQQDHISFFHVRLLGEDCQTLLDLNGFNWALTLEVGFTPKVVQPTLANSFKDTYVSYLRSLDKK